MKSEAEIREVLDLLNELILVDDLSDGLRIVVAAYGGAIGWFLGIPEHVRAFEAVLTAARDVVESEETP